MGRVCGFDFHKLSNGKFVDAAVIDEEWDDEVLKTNALTIYGRCDATDIFLHAVDRYRPKVPFWDEKNLKPEDKYSAYLLLNHPELDGFETHKDKSDPTFNVRPDWFGKYFYMDLQKFKKLFDFDNARKEHNDYLMNLKLQNIKLQEEIESLRVHQENAKTKVAFDGFKEAIEDLKEEICSNDCTYKELEDDDYDYEHFMQIEDYIKKIERLIKENPDLIVTAMASD